MRKLLAFLLFFSLTSVVWSEELVTAGLASWYGEAFHGKMTANGEIYNMNDFTAAHRTLPFGTKVKVVNLLNNKTIIVRVNDRGPFKDDRIIDVSKAAAEELDFIKNGIIPVRIEVLVEGETGKVDSSKENITIIEETLDSSSPSSGSNTTSMNSSNNSNATTASRPSSSNNVRENELVYVQVGSYQDKANASRIAQSLSQLGFFPEVKEKNGFYRVFFEQEGKTLNNSLRLLQEQGFNEPLIRRSQVDGNSINW